MCEAVWQGHSDRRNTKCKSISTCGGMHRCTKLWWSVRLEAEDRTVIGWIWIGKCHLIWLWKAFWQHYGSREQGEHFGRSLFRWQTMRAWRKVWWSEWREEDGSLIYQEGRKDRSWRLNEYWQAVEMEEVRRVRSLLAWWWVDAGTSPNVKDTGSYNTNGAWKDHLRTSEWIKGCAFGPSIFVRFENTKRKSHLWNHMWQFYFWII